MDPTIQRCHGPLKDALDSLVQLMATYIIPTAATLAFLCALQTHAVPIQLVVLCGVVYYWVIHFEAVTTHFHRIVLPRAIDFSLDAGAGQYVNVVLFRVLVGVLVPGILVSPIGRAHPTFVAIVGSLVLWLATVTREVARAEVYGYPYVEAGSRGNRIKPLHFMQRSHPADNRLAEAAIPWGGLSLPLAELLKNFLVIGAVGSGKTLVRQGVSYGDVATDCAPSEIAGDHRGPEVRAGTHDPLARAPLQDPDGQSG